MKHIAFIMRRYYDGDALCNRMIAYIRGFVEHGWSVDLYYLMSDRKLISNINLSNVRVINLWESDGYLAKKIKLISYLKNVILVKHILHKGDVCFTNGGAFYQSLFINYLKSKVHIYCDISEHPQINGTSFFKNIKNILHLKILKKIDGIFVISKSLKDYYYSKGIPLDKLCICNMIVDINRFENVIKLSNEKCITYCGTISNSKDGVDLLIKSFAKFHKKFPDFKLKIVGRAVCDEVLENLKILVKNLNIINQVIFTGMVTTKEMPQILVDATILALARPNNLQAQHGFPTKLGEYLSTGNPVVVTRVGDIPDFIFDKKNGFLANPNDVDDFAEKLIWVADNYEQSKHIAEQGKLLVKNEFSYYAQSEIVINKISKDLNYFI